MKIYIIPMILISPLMTISCNSWFSIWMLMELNLMTFIPLIIMLNKFFKEISIKYFIIQTISSSNLILMANSLMINWNNHFMWINLMMNLSIFMKLGMPPFHTWFINIMNNMTWTNCLITSTWQKIIPMILMSFIFNKMINYITILLSSILSALMGLNHQSLRMIISFSSINHMSWMMLNMMISEMLWILYFSIYMITSWSIIMIFNIIKIYYINQMYLINQFNKFKLMLFLNLISIYGMPPMFGFNMKWISIYHYTLNKLFMINLMMLFMSMMTFLFYMRIMFSFMSIISIKNKLNLINKFNKNNNINYIIILSFMNLWIMSMWLF